MKKQTITKIISGLIILVFVIFIFQFTLPTQAATSTSMSNLYANPNQNGNNTYKFKVSDVVSSQMLTNVVGCTGVVNKVSTWMTKFISSPVQEAKKTAATIKTFVNSLKKACTATKAAAVTAGQSVPTMPGYGMPISQMLSLMELAPPVGNTLAPGPATPPATGKVKACQDQVDAASPDLLAEAQKTYALAYEQKLVAQCLDGIAITLAKNQLTSMTRSMMNWVNTGYGGNPFFVQNMQDLTNNIERNVLETGTDILLGKAFGVANPYAKSFAESAFTSSSLRNSPGGLLGNLQSSLENFVTDPKSYYSNNNLNIANDTRTSLQRAQDANNAFANDFATGGWNGWLALTQIDQNNPLGFTMQASDELARQMAFETQNTKDELTQNNGFLSQKTCDQWQVYNLDGTPKNVAGKGSTVGALPAYSKTKTSDKDVCTHWKTITPGSLIKDKTTAYLNSPERQLELAKTINDSLNALFSVLVSKLQGGGLAGLSDSTENTTNWTDNMNVVNDFTSSDGNSTYDNNGAYDGFNLTRDLGNTYIHDTAILLGTWNANTNETILANNLKITQTDGTVVIKKKGDIGEKLYPDLAPEVSDGQISTNTYYTVTTTGNTKLIVDGYNGWAVGDRAFWDGSKWQNWKCGENTQKECTNQLNPIKNRGVIQIQQDYIVAAKEILKVLPSVMPKLGELDYCIPGPNPSYKTNSTDAQSAYQGWVGSMYVGTMDSSGKRYGVKIDDVGSRTYEDLHNIYIDNPGVWKSIQDSMQFLITTFSNICNDGSGLFGWGREDCGGNYFFANNLSKDDSQHLQDKTDIMDANTDYVNSNLFQNFYESFDKMMNKLYFNNITQKFINTETSTNINPNPDYISMAESGYNLTKDMLYYNDDITKASQDYADAINQAKINIAALEPIKTEVSGIIQAAQVRRATRMVTILNNEAKRNGTATLTEEEYNTRYATCFAEENIQVFDADSITNIGNTALENCSDGIDNDLNGLIDMADPSCRGVTTGGPTAQTPITFYYNLSSCQTPALHVQGQVTTSYATGTTPPTASSLFSSGDVVASGQYYIVTQSGTTPYGLTDIGYITKYASGGQCPVTDPGTQTCTYGGIYPNCSSNPAAIQTTTSYHVTASVTGTGATVAQTSQDITVTYPQTTYSPYWDIAVAAGKTIQISGNCGHVIYRAGNRWSTETPISADCGINVYVN